MVESTLLLVTGRCLATAPWLQPVNNITLDAKRGKLCHQTLKRQVSTSTLMGRRDDPRNNPNEAPIKANTTSKESFSPQQQ